MAFYQIMFHGSGFHSEMEDGATLIGFYTVRRIRARSEEEAWREALVRLQSEEKVQQLYQDAAFQGCTPVIRVDSITRISLWALWFRAYAKGFIFYGDDEDEDE